MDSLHERQNRFQELLAPYAVPIAGTLGRPEEELEDDTRFPFQRDRDRIVHTHAFRRLQGKTQVFAAGESDHVRTRLTHTLEVAQISRDVARTLSLNEDLAECVALAHDLGHPPFGHAGEEALSAWMKKRGSAFEHNEHSLRIVMVLERHSSQHIGLNVNLEIVEGLQKHRHRQPGERQPSLEAQLVNIADAIAYTGHDCDDALIAGLFKLKEVNEVPLAAEALAFGSKRRTSLRGGLIHLLVTDLYEETERRLSEEGIRTLENVYHAPKKIVELSAPMQMKLDELRDFLWPRMYMHPKVMEDSAQGQTIIRLLCDHYEQHPIEKITELQHNNHSTLPVAIKDYVAGMTDGFARMQAEGLGLL